MADEHPVERPSRQNRSQAPGQDYLLSLPERGLRSLAALIGGGSLLLTKTLLPDVLKRSTTYRVLIGDLQKILITRIAQVEDQVGTQVGAQLGGGEPAAEERTSNDFIRKKMAGGVLEAAGLLTIRFSPLWIFAIAGDAAGGSKVFLHRLIKHLKANNVIAQDADPQSLVDLLDAVQTASHASATAIDTPPLSRAELSALADELGASYGGMFAKSQSLLSKFDSIQGRMEQVAEEENISVEKVSGMMAMNAASLGETGIGATAALGRTGAELFGEKILASYLRTLDEISQKGASNYVGETMRPFLKAAVEHLDPKKLTWTETQLIKRKANNS